MSRAPAGSHSGGADRLASCEPADTTFFSTGDFDGNIATATRQDLGRKFEIESADHFVVIGATSITDATFTGLLPAADIRRGPGRDPKSGARTQTGTVGPALAEGAQKHINQTQPIEDRNMTDLTIRTLETATKVIPEGAVTSLRGKLRGPVAMPGEEGYSAARTIWNAAIDRSPALVARCLGAADVINAVKLARDENALVAVRGGGHNIAGNAVCEGGLLIDLSLMKSVRVDPVARTARVEPGATLADFDKEAQAFALATPLGINSTTGVAGLTLGGGFGWTTRKFGLAVDNLISADVVTADAKLVRASENENPDLFWALRGGGGNFGVVTSFEFKLHPLGPEILAGLVVHPLEKAGELLPEFCRIAKQAPDELTVWVVMRRAPPLPFLPTEWHGKEVLIFAACFCGDMEEGEKATQAIRALGSPIVDVISPHPFTGWQAAFDSLLTPGARNYWKSHDFTDLPDAAIKVIVDAVRELPSPECEVFIAQVGGAMARVPAHATAWANRDAHFIMNAHARWRDEAQDSACMAWARQLSQATAPFASGSVYVNFMPEDESDRVEKAYGANLRRLVEIKRRYDPDNLFRMNQNIRPAP
jgi:FAD/FMN-containing dehydrogenase